MSFFNFLLLLLSSNMKLELCFALAFAILPAQAQSAAGNGTGTGWGCCSPHDVALGHICNYHRVQEVGCNPAIIKKYDVQYQPCQHGYDCDIKPYSPQDKFSSENGVCRKQISKPAVGPWFCDNGWKEDGHYCNPPVALHGCFSPYCCLPKDVQGTDKSKTCDWFMQIRPKCYKNSDCKGTNPQHCNIDTGLCHDICDPKDPKICGAADQQECAAVYQGENGNPVYLCSPKYRWSSCPPRGQPDEVCHDDSVCLPLAEGAEQYCDKDAKICRKRCDTSNPAQAAICPAEFPFCQADGSCGSKKYVKPSTTSTTSTASSTSSTGSTSTTSSTAITNSTSSSTSETSYTSTNSSTSSTSSTQSSSSTNSDDSRPTVTSTISVLPTSSSSSTTSPIETSTLPTDCTFPDCSISGSQWPSGTTETYLPPIPTDDGIHDDESHIGEIPAPDNFAAEPAPSHEAGINHAPEPAPPAPASPAQGGNNVMPQFEGHATRLSVTAALVSTLTLLVTIAFIY